MKTKIVIAALLTTLPSISYGNETEALKAELSRQAEQKSDRIKALELEVARQRLLLESLESRLQAMKEGLKQPDSRAFVEIKVDGSDLLIDGRSITIGDLLPAIQAKAGDDVTWPIVIRLTVTTPYEKSRLVLEACAKGGFHNVALVKPTK